MNDSCPITTDSKQEHGHQLSECSASLANHFDLVVFDLDDTLVCCGAFEIVFD